MISEYQNILNIAPNLIDFIHEVTNNCDKNCILQCTISRKTVSEIANKCIGRSLKHEIIKHLKVSPFSLLIDASSDSAYLCEVSGRGTRNPKSEITNFYTIDEEATGEVLYEKVKESILVSHKDFENNLMAVVADKGGLMADQEKGLAIRLQEDYPHVVVFNDLSHIFNLISKESLNHFGKK